MNCLFCYSKITPIEHIAYCQNCANEKDSTYVSYHVENQQMQDCWVTYHNKYGSFTSKLIFPDTLKISRKFENNNLISLTLPPIKSLNQIIQYSDTIIERLNHLKPFL